PLLALHSFPTRRSSDLPSSSSGCAVTISRLVRVWSFCRLCQSAAAPRSKASGWAAGIGRELTALGDCALTESDRTRKGTAQPNTAKIRGSNLLDLDAILPPPPFPKYRIKFSAPTGIAGHHRGFLNARRACRSGIP